MNEIEAVTYAESREAFFAGVLRKAERHLDWAVKHNPDCYVCAEKGEAVAYYQDALDALREQAERAKECVYCSLGIKTISMKFPTTHEYGGTWWTESVRTPRFCPMCGRELLGKRLEVEP